MRAALAYVAVAIGALAAIALARAAAVSNPLADMAVIEIYAREALAGRLTVGPYSHFPWHHPGPLYFYLLAPTYAAGAQRSSALNAGAFAIALASVAALLWVTRRARSVFMSIGVGGFLLAYVIRVDGLLVSAWNPHVVILPTAAVLVAAAALAAGDWAMLPLLAVAGSLAVQTDVALAPTIIAAAVTGLVFYAWRFDRHPLSRRYLTVAAALLIVVWLPPLLEQARNDPGNFRALWRFFVTGGGQGQSSRTSMAAWSEAMTALFRAGIALPTGSAIGAAPGHPAIGGTILLAATAGGAFWARHRDVGLFATICVVASLVSYWSVTRIGGSIIDHQVFWISIVGALDGAAILITVLTMAFHRPAQSETWKGDRSGVTLIAQGVVLAICLVAGLGQMNRARLGSAPVTITLPSVASFGASIHQYLGATGGRKALVRLDQDEWGVAAGILLELSRLGARFAIEDDWASMFPESFRATGDEGVEIAIAASGDRQHLSRRPGDRLIDASTRVEVHAIPIGASRLEP